MTGTTVVASLIAPADDNSVGLISDGWEMLRYGWICARVVDTPYELAGDRMRADDAHDLFFGRAPAWAA